MQAHSATSSSSDSAPATQANSAPASQAHSTHTAGSSTQARKSRTQTKWPEDKLTTTGLDDQGWPTLDAARDRFVLVCGLIAREGVNQHQALGSHIGREERVVHCFRGKARVPSQSVHS